jgi:hypothetical protein
MALSTPSLIDMHPEAFQVLIADFGSGKMDPLVDSTKMTERCLVSEKKSRHYSSFVASIWPEGPQI